MQFESSLYSFIICLLWQTNQNKSRVLIESLITYHFAFMPPHESLLRLALINTEHFIEASSVTDRIFRTDERQIQSMYYCKYSCPSAFASLHTHTHTHAAWLKQTPSHRYPPIHPSSLKNQESLYLYHRKSATNLATICWDIFSFHVFQLGHFFSFMKRSASLHMCASPLFHIIVFEVNPSIVWLLTVLHLARPSAA